MYLLDMFEGIGNGGEGGWQGGGQCNLVCGTPLNDCANAGLC